MYEVKIGIPIPRGRNGKTEFRKCLDSLPVGGMFEAERTPATITMVKTIASASGKKFVQRKIGDGTKMGVWRVA